MLRPGGLLAVAVPFHGRVRDVSIALDRLRAPLRPARAGAALLHGRSLRSLLEALGFERVEVHARRRAAARDALALPARLTSADRGSRAADQQGGFVVTYGCMATMNDHASRVAAVGLGGLARGAAGAAGLLGRGAVGAWPPRARPRARSANRYALRLSGENGSR